MINSNESPAAIDALALVNFCKASADTLRVDILRVLQADSYSVQELCQILTIKQSALSHHLKVLATAGLVDKRREGNTFFYRRRLLVHDYPLSALQAQLYQCIDLCPLAEPLQQAMSAVEQQRISSSNSFFIENSDKFRQQQDLIASFEQYAESVFSMLTSVALPANTIVLELGPGEGLFLPMLATYFQQVIAADTSMAMLLRCERIIKERHLENVQVLHGDSRAVLRQKIAVDAIVVNMVLHHISTPRDIFNDAQQLLKPGGALLITDLCHHDQEWAKDACGDIWLGFEPEDLSHWAAQAGLQEGQASYLAQRNGFKVQIRHFYKPLN